VVEEGSEPSAVGSVIGGRSRGSGFGLSGSGVSGFGVSICVIILRMTWGLSQDIRSCGVWRNGETMSGARIDDLRLGIEGWLLFT
jgi:hypothetical protein